MYLYRIMIFRRKKIGVSKNTFFTCHIPYWNAESKTEFTNNSLNLPKIEKLNIDNLFIPQGLSNHEKNQSSKISCYCPFKCLNCLVSIHGDSISVHLSVSIQGCCKIIVHQTRISFNHRVSIHGYWKLPCIKTRRFHFLSCQSGHIRVKKQLKQKQLVFWKNLGFRVSFLNFYSRFKISIKFWIFWPYFQSKLGISPKIKQKLFSSNSSIWVPKNAEFYADSKSEDKIEKKRQTMFQIVTWTKQTWIIHQCIHVSPPPPDSRR